MNVHIALLVASSLTPLVFAAARTGAAAELNPGDAAPPFSLVGSDGKTHNLADLKGKAVVLAWFAKAFTGG